VGSRSGSGGTADQAAVGEDEVRIENVRNYRAGDSQESPVFV
jgi:hypothetical protein